MNQTKLYLWLSIVHYITYVQSCDVHPRNPSDTSTQTHCRDRWVQVNDGCSVHTSETTARGMCLLVNQAVKQLMKDNWPHTHTHTHYASYTHGHWEASHVLATPPYTCPLTKSHPHQLTGGGYHHGGTSPRSHDQSGHRTSCKEPAETEH